IPVGPGYQVPAARVVREGAGVPVSAVGLITSPQQAEQVLVDGAADAVMLGRAALREPRWALRAAHELGVPAERAAWQPQYARARPCRGPRCSSPRGGPGLASEPRFRAWARVSRLSPASAPGPRSRA